MHQCVKPGAPAIYGSFTSNVDMKSGSPAFGTPEYTQATIASGQLARKYKMPLRASNANASNAPDEQSVYESQMSLWACLLGQVNFILHGHGWIEGGLCASYEKVILDAAMNDLMRPALYGSNHKIIPVIKKSGSSRKTYEFVGPICESTDKFLTSKNFQKLKEKDETYRLSAERMRITAILSKKIKIGLRTRSVGAAPEADESDFKKQGLGYDPVVKSWRIIRPGEVQRGHHYHRGESASPGQSSPVCTSPPTTVHNATSYDGYFSYVF